jgi:8-oxo-dGTP pyrophosphatase MutT (NUDIX family)
MKILERTLFGSNEVFNFFFEHLVDDQGNEVKQYFILEPKKIREDRVAGVGILPIVDGKIGLIEIYRPALKLNCWEIPHGFIDQGETDKAAVIRELSEETGIVSEESDCIYLGQLAPDPGIIGGTISIFYARNGKLTSESKSELGIKQLKFFDFPEIKDMIDSSVILDAITQAAILKYLSLTGKIKWEDK